MKPILLAGETFLTSSPSADDPAGTILTNGATRFIAALQGAGIAVTQIGGERCEAAFPRTVEALQEFSAIVLSDVGALPLLITPETRQGRPSVNRLELIRQWVDSGGGLMMAGGYASFQGMDGMARFHDTPVEDCLPIECLPCSDGLEVPEGLYPEVLDPTHPILADFPTDWQPILGLNKVSMRPTVDARLLLSLSYRERHYPLLAVRDYGRGRTLAWTTDIGPHWLSAPFLNWPGYDALMVQMVRWISRTA